MKALITYNYGDEKMDAVRKLGYELVYRHEDNMVNDEETDDAEILICYDPFRTFDITRMKKLKWVQLSSIGVDQVSHDFISENGIILTNNRGGYSIPMGEWIVLKILEIYKNSRLFHENQKNRIWKLSKNVYEIYGTTIGFLGTGTIAQEAAKRLSGFGTRLIGLNTKGRDAEGFEKCYPLEELDKFLLECDTLVLSIPYTDSTHHIMDKQRLGMMKDGSVIINISRGSIIDENALIEKLEEGKFLGAALDVFEQEPLDKSSRLWEMENVLVTPHNSWVSQMRDERRFEMILENLKRYRDNQPLVNIVDLKKGY
ncbi:MAG: dihydrofolate reductase [Peptoclostridium sp.]|uniref:phosphoglycerate dehydrogenase n=1 Tax=Peptoclostridium sp. TaxID=1904860 RepID=UPI00139CF631|nr:phosphoglycerate dehydrogenase [Peptoclostridium sp.]MZQ75350.1 dihydrofolate reductase [Peptoclostridium sp.]